MRFRREIVVTAGVFLWILVLSWPSRSQAMQGVANVEGLVTQLGTGIPIARARVLLSRIESGAGTIPALTDNTGRFIFQSVPVGKYRVTATHDGYVPAEYGQRGPEQAGTPVMVGPGQQTNGLVVGMVPTGAITGRILNRFGEPLGKANVQALRWAYVNGRATLKPSQTTFTDDRGEYRLYWLQPGHYVVSVVRAEVTRTAEEPPRVYDKFGEGSETDVPVYAPGVVDVSGAALIEVRAGGEVSGMNVMVPEIRTVSVRGRVISNGGSAGATTRAMVSLVSRTELVAVAAQRTAPTTAEGIFEFRGVIPGSYELLAVATEPSRAASGRDTATRRNIPVGARNSLEVGGAGVEGISLSLEPGVNLPGQIRFETNGKQTPNLASLRVQLRSELELPEFSTQSAEVAANGSFMIAGIVQGVYRLSVTGLPPEFYLKTARLEGGDVLNSGVRLDGAPRGPVEIVLSSDSGGWDASVLDNNTAASSGVTVVLVPDSALRRRSDLYHSAVTDTAGRVHIDGVMPGEYKAFAWDYVPRGAWQDSNFMRIYEDLGKPVHIRPGNNELIDLKLIRSGIN